jgi:signal transduction histidine kinase
MCSGCYTRPLRRSARGHGLANMAMRAHRLGGDFDVARGPVKGTVGTWKAPLP